MAIDILCDTIMNGCFNVCIFVCTKTALTSHCASLSHVPNFEDTSVLSRENNYKRRFMLEMLQIIKTTVRKRINFKADTDNLAQNYRHLISKL